MRKKNNQTNPLYSATLRPPKSIILSTQVALCFLVIQSACTPGGSGTITNDNDGDDTGAIVQHDPVVAPGTDIPGLFASADVWSLGSQNVITFGFGAYVEVISILDNEGDGCVGLDSPVAATFSDGRFALDGAFSSNGRSCAVDISARADDCGVEPGIPVDSLQQCDLTDTSGTLTIGRDEANPDDLLLLKLPQCEEVPMSLVSEGDWGIISIHPFSLPFVDDPASLGGVVVIAGEGGSTDRSSILTGVDGDIPLGCIDDRPTGTLTWDGQRLRIDYSLQGDDNSEGLGISGSCSITFDGTMTYCAEFNPADFGADGQAGQLIRTDGAGSFTTPDGTQPLPALYLLTMNPAIRRNAR